MAAFDVACCTVETGAAAVCATVVVAEFDAACAVATTGFTGWLVAPDEARVAAAGADTAGADAAGADGRAVMRLRWWRFPPLRFARRPGW